METVFITDSISKIPDTPKGKTLEIDQTFLKSLQTDYIISQVNPNIWEKLKKKVRAFLEEENALHVLPG